ncbi:MAG: helix-turn-helix transcriptional regulator [Lachnospiraceae bacterium]|nr:helix-turn-helix transcriptional regulator [Lachnospiraceae bacterium]
MAAKKVGTLIKEARTNADMTQEQLARRVSGLSASDISLAERGKLTPTQEQLKQIAKATGVTQASLINAAKGSASKKSSSSAAKSSYMVTADEKKLIQLYRKTDTETKKAILSMLNIKENATEMLLEGLLDNVQDLFGGKK